MTRALRQICYITHPEDFDATLAYWTEALGAGPFYVFSVDLLEATFRGEPSRSAGRVALTMMGDGQVEIIAPTTPDAEIYTEWIRTRGPVPRGGLFHHFRIDTDDFEGTCRQLVDNGAREGLRAKAPGDRDVAYVDARDTLGCYVEVISQNPDVLTMIARMREVCDSWDGSEPVRDYIGFMQETLGRPTPGYAASDS
jgi:hypothetical protein